MDGRRFTAFVFLSTLCGCQALSGDKSATSPLANLPKPKVMMPEAGNATVARAVSTTDPKKNEPIKASTFVAIAQYRDELAANPELSFAEQEQIRSQSRQAYHEALKADPKCSAAYVGLAKSYVAIEDARQAYAMYDKALQMLPKNAELWYEKGLAQARFKDWDGALASMNHCIQIDPDNRMYRRSLGMTQARAGRLDEAGVTLRSCMREEEAYYTLARMCRHCDRPDLAREYAALSIKAHPTYMAAHHLIQELNNPAAATANAVQTVSHQQPAAATPGDGATPNVQVGGIE